MANRMEYVAPYDTEEAANDRIRRAKEADQEVDFNIRCMGQKPNYRMEYHIDSEFAKGKFWVVKEYIPV